MTVDDETQQRVCARAVIGGDTLAGSRHFERLSDKQSDEKGSLPVQEYTKIYGNEAEWRRDHRGTPPLRLETFSFFLLPIEGDT
ncbi:hypothetical protein KIN20_006539 [Parelaphostrongylus tenuis]|uniref:Uncharacterized protein n=1 Tax=Parelaphostrongylus tenuis TaxID=148309 RepID=A0AAD5QJD9_PARTN|nr:hypothetical protein KIN20_006539 [Parelaphostrongylus tenuis]